MYAPLLVINAFRITNRQLGATFDKRVVHLQLPVCARAVGERSINQLSKKRNMWLWALVPVAVLGQEARLNLRDPSICPVAAL